MGWTEGSGLGTEGSGRVDPMYVCLFVKRVLTWLVTNWPSFFLSSKSETAVYAAGVGLGASKGRDISKYTENTGYSQMAKEVVRIQDCYCFWLSLYCILDNWVHVWFTGEGTLWSLGCSIFDLGLFLFFFLSAVMILGIVYEESIYIYFVLFVLCFWLGYTYIKCLYADM